MKDRSIPWVKHVRLLGHDRRRHGMAVGFVRPPWIQGRARAVKGTARIA